MSESSFLQAVFEHRRHNGATSIDVAIEEVAGDTDTSIVTIEDNGKGVASFDELVILGEWLVSLCHSEVEVHSGKFFVRIPPKVFLGKATAQLLWLDELVPGTRLRFTRPSCKASVQTALKRVTEFSPIEIRVGGTAFVRHDFLEGSLHRVVIDGIEVGLATKFVWDGGLKDANCNLHGVRIRLPFDDFDGFLSDTNPLKSQRIKARFNVIEPNDFTLKSSDGGVVIGDDSSKEFKKKARTAVYRFFQMQKGHVLPFKLWEEAKNLGIQLPEASPLLNTWHADPRDEFVREPFGKSVPAMLSDVSNVLLVRDGLGDPHTLEGSLHTGASLPFWLYKTERGFEGYSWYDALPKLVASRVLVDGMRYSQWTGTNNQRPDKIEIKIAIKHAGKPISVREIPCAVHVSSDNLEVEFVAIKDSPWDNDDLTGPFPIDEFLAWATFHCSYHPAADSWQTQKDLHDHTIQQAVNGYFLAPRTRLLAILRKSPDWEAFTIAAKLDLQEIRFKRPPSASASWEIELVERVPVDTIVAS